MEFCIPLELDDLLISPLQNQYSVPDVHVVSELEFKLKS